MPRLAFTRRVFQRSFFAKTSSRLGFASVSRGRRWLGVDKYWLGVDTKERLCVWLPAKENPRSGSSKTRAKDPKAKGASQVVSTSRQM